MKKGRSTPKLKETEIRAQVREYLRWQGWFVFYHLQGLGSYPGLPDLQAVKGGRTLYLEIKRPGRSLSHNQKIFRAELEAAGGEYAVIMSAADLRPLLISPALRPVKPAGNGLFEPEQEN